MPAGSMTRYGAKIEMSHVLEVSNYFIGWQDPESRSYYTVGRLSLLADERGRSTWEFCYSRDAEKRIVNPIVGFSKFDETYRSSELFPFFRNRLLSIKRSDYRSIALSLGFEELDTVEPFEIMLRLEGRTSKDFFEVFRAPLVDLNREILLSTFFVRGLRHIQGSDQVLKDLTIGTDLVLCFEDSNSYDPNATIVLGPKGGEIGYIPAYFAPVVRCVVDRGKVAIGDIAVRVRKIGDLTEPIRQRLLVDVVVPWPSRLGEFDIFNEPFDS